MGLNLVSTIYLWVFCNHLFHQSLFLYFSTLGIDIWFRQGKCSFIEKKIHLLVLQFYSKFQEDTERLCQKFNIVRFLPNSAQWFNNYEEGSSMPKIEDIFPLTFLQLVNGSKN